MSTELTTEERNALAALDTATIHEAQGQSGAMASAIKPIDPQMRVVGVAYTVDCRPDDNLAIHFALTRIEPGEVLVVDAKGFLEAGPWGDLTTLAAQRAGVSGLVIDGAVRDAATIVAMGFPLFSRGLSIKGTAKNQPGRFQVPITCGGVTVKPGDVVVGDRDGVVVVERGRLAEVLRLAQARMEKEESLRRSMAGGKRLADLMNLTPAFERLGLREGR